MKKYFTFLPFLFMGCSDPTPSSILPQMVAQEVTVYKVWGDHGEPEYTFFYEYQGRPHIASFPKAWHSKPKVGETILVLLPKPTK